MWGAGTAASAVARQARANGQKLSLAVPRMYLAVAWSWCSGSSSASPTSACQWSDLVADVSGAPKLEAYIADPVTPVGWTSGYAATFEWATPLFGEGSIWNRYELYPSAGGDLQARTNIVADVIDTPDLQAFAAFGIEQCYQFHGYSLANVQDVSLPGGITGQAMAYTSQRSGSWSIVYSILPVKNVSSTTYERVVLYMQNQHGVVSKVASGQQASVENEASDSVSTNSRRLQLSCRIKPSCWPSAKR